jgi:hypothetical protein
VLCNPLEHRLEQGARDMGVVLLLVAHVACCIALLAAMGVDAWGIMGNACSHCKCKHASVKWHITGVREGCKWPTQGGWSYS